MHSSLNHVTQKAPLKTCPFCPACYLTLLLHTAHYSTEHVGRWIPFMLEKKKRLTYSVIGSAEMLGLNWWCISSEQEKSIWGMENLSHHLFLKNNARVCLLPSAGRILGQHLTKEYKWWKGKSSVWQCSRASQAGRCFPQQWALDPTVPCRSNLKIHAYSLELLWSNINPAQRPSSVCVPAWQYTDPIWWHFFLPSTFPTQICLSPLSR